MSDASGVVDAFRQRGRCGEGDRQRPRLRPSHRASPNLLKYCLTGKHIDSATLVVRKAGGSPLEYFKLTMGDVIVTGVAPVIKETMPTGMEEVSLSFARVKQEYVLQNRQGGSGGTVTASFDIQHNREA